MSEHRSHAAVARIDSRRDDIARHAERAVWMAVILGTVEGADPRACLPALAGAAVSLLLLSGIGLASSPELIDLALDYVRSITTTFG